MHQLREAFPDGSSIRFLVHDNDAIFSERLIGAIGELGIRSKPTAFRSPWQNGIAERWVGTVRRELLDHVVVINERQLRRLLCEYVEYYNEERVHTELGDSPGGRAVQEKASGSSRLIALPRVGGLHHRYEWREAA
jgi:transposase InsO family protein